MGHLYHLYAAFIFIMFCFCYQMLTRALVYYLYRSDQGDIK